MTARAAGSGGAPAPGEQWVREDGFTVRIFRGPWSEEPTRAYGTGPGNVNVYPVELHDVARGVWKRVA